MSKLQEYIRKCQKAGLTDEAIKKYLLSYNVSENSINETFKKINNNRHLQIGVLFTLIILTLGIFALNPQFIGFVTLNENIVYTDTIKLNITENSQIIWTPEQSGELTSLLASGKIIGNGTVKMYITINKTRYLIIDSTTIQKETHPSLLTGLVIGTETINEEQIKTENQTTRTISPEIETPTQETIIEENITQTNTEPTQEEMIPEINQTITETNETISLEINETTSENNSTETIIENNETISENNSTESINETLNEINETNIVNETEITIENNETIIANKTEISDEIINETTPEEVIPEINESIIDINETDLSEIKEFENICQETCTIQGAPSDTYILEFEVEGDARIIIDNLKYTVKETIIEETPKINETLNISINKTQINLTINETLNFTANTTINQTLNETQNESLKNTTELNATINSTIEIDKPVKWIMRIDKNKTKEIILPKEAFNITTNDEKIKIRTKNQELNITQYNQQKEKEILKKDLKKLEIKQTKEKNKQQKNKNKETRTKYDQNITEINTRIKELTTITTNITIDQNITLTFNNQTNETNTSPEFVDIQYYTEGPETNETELNDYNKIITISSDLHYTNIKAYTDITETQKELINLYWKTEQGNIKVNNIIYIDTNNNTLIDRIEWTVPHLSNQTYEINISVLNIQSYPQVGGTWKIAFQTTGKANLTIETTNGTTFETDLEHLNLKCGEQTLTPTYDGEKIFYQDFECNETATHEVLVKTQGKHTQKFTFGNVSAYAYNYATNLPKTINLHGKLTNNTGGLVNTTVNFTFALYTTPSTPTSAWNETQNNINVTEGIYTAILGSVNQININLTQPYWLGIKVNNDPEMTPRINLTSTSYTFNTMFAENAADLTCTDCIGNQEINTTGTFQIDGNLNATNNITLGNSILGLDSKPRIQITNTSLIINLQN